MNRISKFLFKLFIFSLPGDDKFKRISALKYTLDYVAKYNNFTGLAGEDST